MTKNSKDLWKVNLFMTFHIDSNLYFKVLNSQLAKYIQKNSIISSNIDKFNSVLNYLEYHFDEIFFLQ